jgi:hypothetical protein
MGQKTVKNMNILNIYVVKKTPQMTGKKISKKITFSKMREIASTRSTSTPNPSLLANQATGIAFFICISENDWNRKKIIKKQINKLPSLDGIGDFLSLVYKNTKSKYFLTREYQIRTLASLAANKFSSTSVISIIHIHRGKLQYKFISTET